MLRSITVRVAIPWTLFLKTTDNVLRICLLLERWISTYPSDFAVPGVAGALRALIKSTLSKSYLLHYGAHFLPFLENIPNLQDRDASWALRVEEDSDQSSLVSEDDLAVTGSDSKSLPELPSRARSRNGSQPLPGQTLATRDRKSSLPLSVTAKALGFGYSTPPSSVAENPQETSPKQLLKRLQSMSDEVLKADFTQIAESITRIEARYFLRIEASWLTSSVLRTMLIAPLTATALVTTRVHAGEERSRG